MSPVPTTAARRRALPAWLFLVVVLVGLGAGWWQAHHDAGTSAATAPSATSQGRHTPDSGLATVAESRLPAAARQTLALIDAGGPFPYAQDGVVFENREGILPHQGSGYYHEYTVPKPGEPDRGPWRLVLGQGGEIFWTADHYDSFQQVREGT